MAEGHGRGFTTEILHSDRLGGPNLDEHRAGTGAYDALNVIPA
ncbi:MAG: hypothetical protein ACO2ZC_11505 [Pseudomonadales bacterium]